MSDEQKAVQPEATPAEVPKAFLTETEVYLPYSKEKYVVKKLRAGKYNEAQKVFTAWISELQKMVMKSQVELKGVMGADGKPDATKLAGQLDEETQRTVSILLESAGDASTERMKLIALGLQLTMDEVNEKFYPEDLEVLLGAINGINAFMENLKKSVAPTLGQVA